jgi:hypothetical protein
LFEDTDAAFSVFNLSLDEINQCRAIPMLPRIYIFLACYLGFFWSCQKELSIDNTDKGFPVSLRVTGPPDNPTIEWDRFNDSRFKRYILVVSEDSIASGLSPLNLPVLVSTTDQDSLRATNISNIILPELYFKLYVDIGNRENSDLPANVSKFLESPTIKLNFNNFIVDGSPALVRFVPEKNWIFVVNNANSTNSCNFELIDLNTNQIINTKTGVPLNSLGGISADIDKKSDGTYEFYWLGSNSQYRVFDLPSLELKQTVPIPTYVFTLVSNGTNDQVIVTQPSSTEGVSVHKSSNFDKLHEEFRLNYFDYRSLAILDADEGLMVETGPFSLRRFNVNPTSGVITNTETVSITSDNVLINSGTVVSADGQLFIPDQEGIIYDRNLNQVANVPTFPDEVLTDFSFSVDDQFIYCISQNISISNTTFIKKLKYPEMIIADQLSLINVRPLRVFPTDDGIYFVGSAVNNSKRYVIKKLNL